MHNRREVLTAFLAGLAGACDFFQRRGGRASGLSKDHARIVGQGRDQCLLNTRQTTLISMNTATEITISAAIFMSAVYPSEEPAG
ncbi:MAG TPA: hypothetical protein VG055_10850 [Planctomycetaceae bacterium]|jgi:hypothetical protein|nr:hypothetical protein [Planctomycetaceae bacterium]